MCCVCVHFRSDMAKLQSIIVRAALDSAELLMAGGGVTQSYDVVYMFSRHLCPEHVLNFSLLHHTPSSFQQHRHCQGCRRQSCQPHTFTCIIYQILSSHTAKVTRNVTVCSFKQVTSSIIKTPLFSVSVDNSGMSSLSIMQVCHRQTAAYIGHRTAGTAL